jgi:type IV secretory pathway protease TraF
MELGFACARLLPEAGGYRPNMTRSYPLGLWQIETVACTRAQILAVPMRSTATVDGRPIAR